MKKAQALLFCALLVPAVALAQESDSQPKAEGSGQQATSENAQSDAMQKKQPDASQGNKMQQTTSEEPSAATAQDKSTSKQDSASASSGEAMMQEQGSDQVRSAQLVGSDIVNASDEKIGAIDDLLLSKDGQVVGIIVGVGGFLGIGEKHVALAWDAVDITRGENDEGYQIKTSLDKAALEEAEAFKTEEKQQAEQRQQQQQQQMEQQQQQTEQQQQQGQEEQQQ